MLQENSDFADTIKMRQKLGVSVETLTPAVAPQPQPLTVKEYLQRQQRKKEKERTKIPVTEPPKHRRGGRLVRLRRRRADIINTINNDPPPSWERASELWLELEKIEEEMKHQRKTKRPKH